MALRSPWTWGITCSLIAGTAMGAACLALPPLHTPTHEFAQAFTALGFVLVFFMSHGVARRVPSVEGACPVARLRASLTPALTAAAILAAAALAVLATANAFGPRCRFGAGMPFFWTTWAPTAALGCVTGCLSAGRGRSWRRAMLVPAGIVLLSLLQDAAQTLSGARVADLLVGAPLALDQRADMTVPLFHVYQRLFVLGSAAALWQLGLWRAAERAGTTVEARLARSRGLLLAGALLVVVLAAGSHIGVGWGRGALHGELSGVRASRHFVFRYAPHGDAARHMDGIVRTAEWNLLTLRREWGFRPSRPLRVYVFDSSEAVRALTGTGTHARIRSLYLDLQSARDETLLHEMIHALHIELNPRPTVVLNRGLLEGLAMAYEGDYALLPEAHSQQAGALRAGALPSAADFMTVTGFWRVGESNAYYAAGSFVGFLIYEYGFERFRELQRTLDFERAYGKPLVHLDEEWRTFLEGVPVTLDTQLRAGEHFDSTLWPAYLDECCPKVGERDPSVRARVVAAMRAGDYADAFAMLTELYADDGRTRWAYLAARCLLRLERPDEALDMLHSVLERPDLSDHEYAHLLEVRMYCQMAVEDWPGLYETLEEQRAISPDFDIDAALLERGLRTPEMRAGLARALTTYDRQERRRIFEELFARRPDDDALAYLFATRGFPDLFAGGGLRIEPSVRADLGALLALLDRAPDAADRLAGRLQGLAERAVFLAEYELAERVFRRLEAYCDDAHHRLRAARGLARIRYETRTPDGLVAQAAGG